MKHCLLILTITLLCACVPSTKVAETTTGSINSDAPYRWHSSYFPRTIQISEDFSTAEVTAITSMADAWEDSISDKKNFFNISGTPATEVDSASLDLDSLGDDSVNGVYRISHWPTEIDSRALAVTQIFGRRYNIGRASEYVMILHADILINENLYNFRTTNYTNNNTYDLLTVVLHEMGHYLGLQHRYGDSVMIEAINQSTQIRAPRPADITDISSLYGITLPLVAGNMAMAVKAEHTPQADEPYAPSKLIIELRSNGECVHKENGIVIKRHPASLK